MIIQIICYFTIFLVIFFNILKKNLGKNLNYFLSFLYYAYYIDLINFICNKKKIYFLNLFIFLFNFLLLIVFNFFLLIPILFENNISFCMEENHQFQSTNREITNSENLTTIVPFYNIYTNFDNWFAQAETTVEQFDNSISEPRYVFIERIEDLLKRQCSLINNGNANLTEFSSFSNILVTESSFITQIGTDNTNQILSYPMTNENPIMLKDQYKVCIESLLDAFQQDLDYISGGNSLLKDYYIKGLNHWGNQIPLEHVPDLQQIKDNISKISLHQNIINRNYNTIKEVLENSNWDEFPFDTEDVED